MSNSLISEIAKEFVSGSREIVDIITFVEAPWGLNLKLFPTQKFILRCFYGMPLDNVTKNIPVPDLTNEHILFTLTEQEFLAWLYAEGRCNTNAVEGKIFNELILSIGRRGTKSTTSACISNYELYKLLKRGNPALYYGQHATAKIAILNVAPTDDQAGDLFDIIQGLATNCPFMKDRALHTTQTYFDLMTDDDIRADRNNPSLISIAGGCSSNGLRGKNAILVIMDEMAFFIDNAGRFSGGEVYKALTPSAANFKRDGKILCMSSPYAKYGKFYERFIQSKDEPNTLMFKMYSAMGNPSLASEILIAARRRDRASFMCEFGGEFSDTITAWIDDENEFKQCITEAIPPPRGVPDTAYYWGLDLGFKNDGTGLAIVHKDRDTDQIVLDYADVWFSGASDVWEFENSIYKDCTKYYDRDLIQMSDIMNDVKELMQWFPAKSGIFDQHNGYALAELFRQNQLLQFEMVQFTESTNSEVFELVKRLYAENLISLYNHPVLVPELMTLEAEARAKIKVRAPTRRGCHDDISVAYARAVWSCFKNHQDRPKNIATGSGGSVSRVGESLRTETAKSFLVKQQRLHGEHPRVAMQQKQMFRNALSPALAARYGA